MRQGDIRTALPQMRENDIRPDDLMAENDRLHAHDLQWLIARQADFIQVACPACGRNSPEPCWEKDGFHYARCGACGTGYLNPRPAPALLADYYQRAENYRFWREVVFPRSESARRERIVRPRVDRILEICRREGVGQGTLVEIGAGFGTFCAEMAERRVFERVIAVEPTPPNAAACRDRGIQVIEASVEQADLPAEADLVVSFEVIEHLFDPRGFLYACRRILRPGGLLVVTCPNILGFDVMTLGSVSQVVDPEHLNYFHPQSLSDLVHSCGFSVLEVTTPGQLDAEIVRKRSQARLFDLSAQPFLRHLLLDEWERLGEAFQRFLSENRLSSHLWIVGRRGTP